MDNPYSYDKTPQYPSQPQSPNTNYGGYQFTNPASSGQDPYQGSYGQPQQSNYGAAGPIGAPAYGVPSYGTPVYGVTPYGQLSMVQYSSKNWVVALFLCFFLGVFGAHNFYLGYNGRGLTQLGLLIVGTLLSIVFIGLFLLIPLYIWVFVELILLLTGSSGYDRDALGVPLER